MTRGVAPSPLTVLVSFPALRATTNPYIVTLARELSDQPDLDVRYFSWNYALIGRYDVFHTHWPELFVAGKPGPKRAARQLLFFLLLVRLWAGRVPVVRTLHNVRPHHGGRTVEKLLLRQLDRLTGCWIRLNPQTETPDSAETSTILHGDYIEWFASYPQPTAEPGRLLFAGLIRDYKNIPALIMAFAGIDDPAYRLKIAGNPSSAELARSLQDEAAGDSRVSFDFEYVSDTELADAVGRCELMVLPYAEMHNSGAALMALSMRRPVLVPDNEITRSLAEEVGPGWVYRFVGALSAADIAAAITDRRQRAAWPPPDLTRRSWGDAGSRHLDVYRAARLLRGRLSRQPLQRK